MEAAALVVLSAVMLAHAWHMLRFIDLKSLGVIAGVGAIFLGLLVFWRPLAPAATMVDPAATGVWVLLAALYAAALAGVALWGLDPRTLGFYALGPAVAALLLLVHFLGLEGNSDISRSTLQAVTSFIQVVLFGLLFFHLAPPFRRLQTLTGWFFLVGAALLGVIGIGIPIGLWPSEFIAR